MTTLVDIRKRLDMVRFQLAEETRDWALWNEEHKSSGVGHVGAKSSTPTVKSPSVSKTSTPKISITGRTRSEIMQSLGSTVDQITKQHRGSPGALATKVDKARSLAKQRLAELEKTKTSGGKRTGASKAKRVAMPDNIFQDTLRQRLMAIQRALRLYS